MPAGGHHSGKSTQQVVTLLPLNLWMALNEIAHARGTTKSSLVREACEAFVAKIKAGG